MLELARYEASRRLRGAVVMGVLLAAFGVVMVLFFPSIQDSVGAIEEYAQNLPPVFQEMFGIEGITEIGGFLATELYQFVWVILLGIYFAYRAGSLIAGDVETHRIDLLLATPVSRTRLLLERFLATVPGMVIVNLVVFPVVYIATVLVGYPIDPGRLALVHALSIPYFLTTAAIGLVVSTLTDSESLANRVAMGLVFGLFVLESVAATAGYDAVGHLSPTRYYDPSAILVEGAVDWAGALLLLVATGALVFLARTVFVRADIE